MKKYIYLAFALLGTTACNDFLSQDPDDRTYLKNQSDLKELLVSAYPETSYYEFTETASDNMMDIGSWLDASIMRRSVEEAYWWKVNSDEGTDSPAQYWYSCYGAISAANTVLRRIETGTDEEKEEFAGQKGEALLCRAYAHYMLVNIFSMPYNPATNDQAMGIPYMTEPENVVFGEYDRSTVGATYAAIQADLEAGLPLIDDNSYTVPKYHFTKAAAAAFASRFYQTICDWDNVIKYANIALGSGSKSLIRPWNTTYQELSIEELEQTYTRYSESANLLLNAQISLWGRLGYNRYSLTSDLRKTLFQTINPVDGDLAYSFVGYSSHDAVFIVKFKEHFKKESINANYGLPYVMAPVLTAEEALLNRAEAYVMKGMYSEAYADLNDFLSTRVLNYRAGVNSVSDATVADFAKAGIADDINCYYSADMDAKQINTLKTILMMRRQEFVFEGMRWFDIRRFGITVTHQTIDKKVTDVLTQDDPRKAFQLPKQAITLGLEANPR